MSSSAFAPPYEPSSYGSGTVYGTSYASSTMESSLGGSPDRRRYTGNDNLPLNATTRIVAHNSRFDRNGAPMMMNNYSALGSGSEEHYPHHESYMGRENLTASPFGSTFWNSELEGRGNSIVHSVVLLVSCAFTASQLTQPYATSLIGFVPFLLLQLIAALASYGSATLLIDLSEATSVTSYEALGLRTWGRGGAVLVALSVVLQSLLSVSGIFWVLGNTILPALGRWWFKSPSAHDLPSTILCAICGALFVVPASMLRRLRHLSIWLSVTAFLMVMCFTGVIVWQWTEEGGVAPPCPTNPNISPSPEHNSSLIKLDAEWDATGSFSYWKIFVLNQFENIKLRGIAVAIPCILSSSTFHILLLPVYLEGRGSRRQGAKRRNTVRAAQLGAFLNLAFNACIGVFGYLRYRERVQPNYLGSMECKFGSNSLEVNLVCLFFGIALIVVVPVSLFAAKKAIICTLIPAIRCKALGKSLHYRSFLLPNIEENPAPSSTMHFVISTCLCGLVVALSICLPSILDEVIIAGSTTAVTLTFLLPAVFFFKLHGFCARDANGNIASFSCDRLMALVLLIVGLVLMLISLVGVVFIKS